MKKNKKKVIYIQDDGHTIYNMDVDGMPHRRVTKNESSMVTKDEKKLLLKETYKAYFKVLLIALVGFAIAMLLIELWLKGVFFNH